MQFTVLLFSVAFFAYVQTLPLEFLEGPSTRNRIVGPDGSVIESFQPGGRISTDGEEAIVSQAEPEAYLVAPREEQGEEVFATEAPRALVITQENDKIDPKVEYENTNAAESSEVATITDEKGTKVVIPTEEGNGEGVTDKPQEIQDVVSSDVLNEIPKVNIYQNEKNETIYKIIPPKDSSDDEDNPIFISVT